MSASQDKKRRTDERALGTERRQVASQKEAKERKQSKIKWTVGSIIVVAMLTVSGMNYHYPALGGLPLAVIAVALLVLFSRRYEGSAASAQQSR